MAHHRDFRPNADEFSSRIEEECRALYGVLAVDILGDNNSECVAESRLHVCQEPERDQIFFFKQTMRLDRLTAYADELGALAAEVFVHFAKLRRFFGTPPSVVLRVEVENELPAEQIFSGNLNSGIVVNGQQRHGGAWFKHAVRILPHGQSEDTARYCYASRRFPLDQIGNGECRRWRQ